jgi:hypothetical protein
VRKPIIWIFFFLTLTFLGDRLFGFLLQNMAEKSQFRYARLYGKKVDTDILFLGNSRGLNFYQPEVERITSEKTFNLSYNGMPADLAKCLVFDYFERNKAPRLMVIDITFCDRENDMLKSGFNMFTPKSERLSDLIRNIAMNSDSFSGKKILWGGKVSHLYRYNSEIFQRTLFYKNKPDTDWIVDRIISQSAVQDSSLKSYKVDMYPNMVQHLKEIVALAQSKGTEVQLVINPYYAPFAQTIDSSFLSPLKNIVEQQTGLTVTDFSKIIQNIDEIGDFQHLNKKGAIHYMNILAEKGILKVRTESAQKIGNIQDTGKNEETLQVSDPQAPLGSETSTTALDEPVRVYKTQKRMNRHRKSEGWFSTDTLFSF